MLGVRNRTDPNSNHIHRRYASPSSVAIVTIEKCAVNKFYNKFYGSDIKRSLALAGFVIDCDMPCFR